MKLYFIDRFLIQLYNIFYYYKLSKKKLADLSFNINYVKEAI